MVKVDCAVDETTKCIKVYKKLGEKVRRLLQKYGIIDNRYRVFCSEDYVYIPIINTNTLQEILKKEGIDAILVDCKPVAKRGMNKQIPGHDIVGDVVIVRDNVIENYGVKYIIDTITSIYPYVKSIYVKKGTESDFRISNLSLLWGEEKKYIIHKEYGLKFFILINKVYFNPRLSTEHYLVSQEVRDGEFIIDLFSGIGGFTLHIAMRRKALILANDLNEHAVNCLVKSVELNKKKLVGDIIASLYDARHITDIVAEGRADRIIANLPHNSLGFIDVYNRLSHKGTILYLYVIGSDEEQVKEKVLDSMDGWMILGIRRVLDYAPRKYVFRVKLTKIYSDK